jgi:hypothetical protein
MKDQLNTLLAGLKAHTIPFSEVLTFIENYYQHEPTAFKNGETYNESNQNQGSAKVFAFAKMNNLSAGDTLSLFAEHYQAVLAQPAATDHQNIRQFMAQGWEGIHFEGTALVPILHEQKDTSR